MNSSEEIPVYAKAEFVLYPEKILEDLTYFYHDPSRVYHGLLEIGVLNGELEFIKNNMQLFLNQDIFMVNGLKKRLMFWIRKSSIRLNVYSTLPSENPFLKTSPIILSNISFGDTSCA